MDDAERAKVAAHLDRIVARTNAIADRLDRVTHAPRPTIGPRPKPRNVDRQKNRP